MAISYETLGSEWEKNMFTVFVGKHRFTYEQLEKNPEFTINIPLKEFDKKIIGVCGSKSGRDMDKVAELGLTLVDSDIRSVPGIKEYPQDVDSTHPFANKDYHEMFYGEIVNAYIIS